MRPLDEADGPGRERSRPTGAHLPAALAADSLEALAAERYTRTPITYLSVIAIVAIACAALPLIHVPVGVRAPGLVRPTLEKQEIRAPVSGRVTQVAMREGRRVAAGEPLLRLSTRDLSAAREGLRVLRGETAVAVSALEALTMYDPGESPVRAGPRSGVYAAELSSHLAMLSEQRARGDRLERELGRVKLLTERGLLPIAHLERLAHDLDEQTAAMRRLAAEDRARWARELADRRRRLDEIDREWTALRLEEGLTVVASPGEGTLEEIVTPSVGSYIGAGERIASLAPTSGFRVEVHVDARGVSLIRPGAIVRLRVGGYDPGEWGLLTGRVTSISNDAVAVAGRPVFRLGIALDRDHLELPDGRVGPLRHGLPVEARIIVARPSVYQLLRGNLTDWVRPGGPAG